MSYIHHYLQQAIEIALQREVQVVCGVQPPRSTDAKAAWDHCPMLVVFLRILIENELEALRRKMRILEERSKSTRGVRVLRTGCSKNADRIVVA